MNEVIGEIPAKVLHFEQIMIRRRNAFHKRERSRDSEGHEIQPPATHVEHQLARTVRGNSPRLLRACGSRLRILRQSHGRELERQTRVGSEWLVWRFLDI